MTRRLLTIAIFLLAGAAVNVGVAWGCALLAPVEFRFLYQANKRMTWLCYRHAGTGHDRFILRSRAGGRMTPAPAKPQLPRYASIPDLAPNVLIRIHHLGAGWPVRALSTSNVAIHHIGNGPNLVPDPDFRGAFWQGGLLIAPETASSDEIGLRPFEAKVLPLQPIWPGFAVNTIVYAALLWLLIPGPFTLRRLIRQRRGLCPNCAYPMGESAVCTECGRELPQRVRAVT